MSTTKRLDTIERDNPKTPEELWREFETKLNQEEMVRQQHEQQGETYAPEMPSPPKCKKPLKTRYIGDPTRAHLQEAIQTADALIVDRLWYQGLG